MQSRNTQTTKTTLRTTTTTTTINIPLKVLKVPSKVKDPVTGVHHKARAKVQHPADKTHTTVDPPISKASSDNGIPTRGLLMDDMHKATPRTRSTRLGVASRCPRTEGSTITRLVMGRNSRAIVGHPRDSRLLPYDSCGRSSPPSTYARLAGITMEFGENTKGGEGNKGK